MHLHPFHSLAINHAELPDGQGIVLGLAANAQPGDTDPWLLLAPYGETAYWHEDKPGGGWRQFRQVFTRTQGERMAAAFNSLAARKGGAFRGLPIYSGHPDADPRRWPDERRLGGVVAVEARGDGFYVRAAWNDLGEKNRAEGYFVYPSPAWLYDQRAARSSGVIAPEELRSVGMTNTPRIQDVPAWTNADEQPPAPLPADPDPATPAAMDYKHALLTHLGLAAEASDEDIRRALDGAHAAATNSEAQRGQLAADAARFRAAAVNAQLDAAIHAGRLSAAERPGFTARFEQDFDAAVRELSERRLALNTRGLQLRPTGAGVDLSTAQGRAAAFNARMDALMRPVAAGGRGLKFDAAIAEMRATSEDAALLRAMNAAA